MKRYLYLSALVCLIGCHKVQISTTTQKRTGPVTLAIFGQSNGVSNAPTPVCSVSGQVEVTNMRTLEQVVPTAWGCIDTSSSWIYLGDLIYGATGRPTKVFNKSVGSTSTQDWMNTSSNSLLSDLLATVRDQKPQYVLWVGGESDYIYRLDATTIYANLKSMINQIHQIDPEIIVFLAIDGDADGSYTVPSVWAEQQLIRDGYAMKGADVQAIRLAGEDETPGPYTGYHLSDRGYQILAEDFFSAMRNFL